MKLRAPAWYFGALTLSSGAKVVLEEIAESCVRGRKVFLTQERWGQLHGRTRRTIARQLHELRERGLIRVIRRGRKLSNLYYLARSLWGRLTGQIERKLPSDVQESLYRLFTSIEEKAGFARGRRRWGSFSGRWDAARGGGTTS